MKCLAIIPARYASTRFPGKPLANIHGKSMIRRVYEQVLQAKLVDKVVVATDDQRIANEVDTFNGHWVMTLPSHPSGTDRCFEALQKTEGHFDTVVNVQGDEPFIDPRQIDQLIQLIHEEKAEIGTLAKRIDDTDSLFNPNVVKVVVDHHNNALYFSRHPIPYVRNFEAVDWLAHHSFFKHMGIYAFTAETLNKITHLPLASLEKAESLEQLRWLQNGIQIKVGFTETQSQAIDTPEDLQKLLNNI